MGTDGDDDSAIRFWLPPIRLPPLFPEGTSLVLPPGPSGRPLLLAAVLLADGLDAALLLGGVGPGYVRALGVVALAGVLLGWRGLLVGWELLAAAFLPVAAATPTLTLLAVPDLLGLWDPEEVEGDAEREREPPDERE